MKMLSKLTQEDRISQESLLEGIKFANALTMVDPIGQEDRSVADKVREILCIGDGCPADLMVTVGDVYDDHNQIIGEKVWVRADCLEDGQEIAKFTPVAYEYEGLILPEDNFTAEEAMALSAMVRGLREARQNGQLPNLNYMLVEIEGSPADSDLPQQR